MEIDVSDLPDALTQEQYEELPESIRELRLYEPNDGAWFLHPVKYHFWKRSGVPS